MKRTLLCLAVASFLAWTGPALAKIGTADVVPGSTLLLPYFELDPNDVNGITTRFAINNASSTAILAHVTLWTDLAVPTYAFDVYLTGFDVQDIDLRDIFNGIHPQTASDGQDTPGDTISPQGPISQDINFASCTTPFFPVDPNDPNSPVFFDANEPGLLRQPLSAATVAALRAAHSGQPSTLLGGLCGGQSFGDVLLRGFVTVDTVNACTRPTFFPSSPSYFGVFGAGVGTTQNVLWGDYSYVKSNENFAQGESLVSIEADFFHPLTSSPGAYTFYARYTNDPNDPNDISEDYREKLPTIWGAPDLVYNTSDLLVWRDPGFPQGGFACPAVLGSRPPWYPLSNTGDVVAFDYQEGPADVFVPGDPVVPFPAAANRVRVGSSAFLFSFRSGWAYLNLDLLNGSVVDPSPPIRPVRQAYVSVLQTSLGRFGSLSAGIAIDSQNFSANLPAVRTPTGTPTMTGTLPSSTPTRTPTLTRTPTATGTPTPTVAPRRLEVPR